MLTLRQSGAITYDVKSVVDTLPSLRCAIEVIMTTLFAVGQHASSSSTSLNIGSLSGRIEVYLLVAVTSAMAHRGKSTMREIATPAEARALLQLRA